VAAAPTVYIITSDQTRNGKTLLARLVADYLLLDGRDPFLIETSPPEAPLRNYFPGRTQVVDFANVLGQIKIFDTILTSVGRDYVIDLSSRHMDAFFEQVKHLNFASELKARGYQRVIFFVVDAAIESHKAWDLLTHNVPADLKVPVRNAFVGSSLGQDVAAFDIPVLHDELMKHVSERHFSIREFVLGDPQNLLAPAALSLKRFVYAVMQGLNDIEPALRLANARDELD
jgi:hypothetical protein